jgi:F0F1-type ATP synthase assembly protein I
MAAAKKKRRRNPSQFEFGSFLSPYSGRQGGGDSGRKGPQRAAAERPGNAAFRRREARERLELAQLGAMYSHPLQRKRRSAKPKAKSGKLRGAAKAAFLRRMAAGRRKAKKPQQRRKTTTTTHRRGKLRGAAKAAFLRRMAAGRRGVQVRGRKSYVSRARHRKGVKKHLRAIVPIPRRSMVAGLVRLNPRTGAMTMTKVANPRRKKKTHRRHAHRVRNPSFRGALASIKSTAVPMLTGGLAGLGAGFIDAKYLGSKPTVSIVAKLLLALAGAAALGKKHPMAAAGWAGGLVGSTGYHAGVNFGGGMVGLSPAGALKGIADMAADDPEMAAMIAGLGDVVDSDGMGDAADEYNEQLEDAEDDMGDVVDAEAA